MALDLSRRLSQKRTRESTCWAETLMSQGFGRGVVVMGRIELPTYGL